MLLDRVISGSSEISAWLKQATDSTQRAAEAIRGSAVLQIPPSAIADAARPLEHFELVKPALVGAIGSHPGQPADSRHIKQLWCRYAPELVEVGASC